MHFLGLAGNADKSSILDYPDAFSGFNLIASYGSIIALFGLLFFLLFNTLTTSKSFNKG